MSDRSDFNNALDSQPLVPADIIVVLRNWSRELTQERMNKAIDLLFDKFGSALVMTQSSDTYAEACKIRRMFGRSIKSMILVTHRDHHYRAFLTFAKVMPTAKIISSPVDSPLSEIEFQKIKRYQDKGDLISYREGLEKLT